MTEGQQVALEQLQRIANVNQSAIQIVGFDEPNINNNSLRIDIKIDCTRYERTDSGLPLHDFEGVTLSISTDFPFKPPSVNTIHSRFLGFPHIQWRHHLCLYQSTDTQWNPSKGMFGFMEQLDEWFKRGSRGELDAPEGPLHPPVTYPQTSVSICVNANTPSNSTWPWFGVAILDYQKPNLLEVNEWRDILSLKNGQFFAPTILLDFELPFEYPRTIKHLFSYLEEKGMGSQLLYLMILASKYIPEGKPLYIGIGTPSRGIAGDDLTQRCQHLAFWEIREADVIKLHAASIAFDINQYKGQDLPQKILECQSTFNDLLNWCNQAQVRWCRVIENRPEIITRRDEDSKMDWFRNKRVTLWGCGAIGGLIAEHLVRTGISQLTLYDKGCVTPGLLVRQNFTDADIGDWKTSALKRRLESVAPKLKINVKNEDIISNTLNSTNWNTDTDILIDATASLSIRSKLEMILKTNKMDSSIASLMISSTAQYAIATVIPPSYQAGTLDVFRRMGLATINRDWLKDWREAFWGTNADQSLRQPEPGCSDPTFIASHVDVAALTAQSLNLIAKALEDRNESASGFLISHSQNHRNHEFQFQPDIPWVMDGIGFRLSANAWRDMNGWIRSGARERTAEHETGGLLFGEFNEMLGIAWITSISGPPRDSTFSPEEFVCGTHGTSDLCTEYEERTNGIVQYIGTWHSHPISSPKPSETDYNGIANIFASVPDKGVHQLMVIIGYTVSENPTEIGAYVFEKQSLMFSNEVNIELEVRGGVIVPPPVKPIGKKIGLALSGGGSRAIAFHLGTLRALEDLMLLDEINVISGVSGGSVMTGLFGYTNIPFAEIDKKTVSLLRRGLVLPTLKKLAHPIQLSLLLWNFITVVLPKTVTNIISWMACKISSFLPKLRPICEFITQCSWPLRRNYSITHVVADVMADIVGRQKCSSPTRQGKSIVFNACELRTGTAFRMSNKYFGSWRCGWASASKLRVADAVTASAAYPLLLPPFDWKKTFERQGQTNTHRLIVTDGGVFENLGVSVMEPGRNSQISKITYEPDIIIASDSGIGQLTGEVIPISLLSRMIQSFTAVMRKVQDATKKRLHDHTRNRRIDKFIYVNLGQIDSRVPLKSANWVDRKEVIHYPTDFSKMSEDNIRKLTGRGEAITRVLVAQYMLNE